MIHVHTDNLTSERGSLPLLMISLVLITECVYTCTIEAKSMLKPGQVYAKTRLNPSMLHPRLNPSMLHAYLKRNDGGHTHYYHARIIIYSQLYLQVETSEEVPRGILVGVDLGGPASRGDDLVPLALSLVDYYYRSINRR